MSLTLGRPTMPAFRVLDQIPAASLDAHRLRGGGRGLEIARQADPRDVIAAMTASGLRGRGGAGFPTGIKWQTVAAACSAAVGTTVVINAAEGEPGTFKDRAILRANPYRVLEGALIAAHVVGADRVVLGIKASFHQELARVRSAIDEISAAGWCDDVAIDVAEGPSSYLFGEETAMLEVIEGRQPFPRTAPPFRRGIDADAAASAAATEFAVPGGSTEPPALVDNVETLANVAMILERGDEWFRRVGTHESPGTVVCTVTGDVQRHGVIEVPMGTSLRAVIEQVGGGLQPGRSLLGVLSGVSNPIIGDELLDTPLSYEAMADAGLGLGSCGFIVFDDRRDLMAIAQGVARFLAVESCGQCTPCKRDGLVISDELNHYLDGADGALDEVRERLRTVGDGARCNLARQQIEVVGSIITKLGPDSPAAIAEPSAGESADGPLAEPMLIAPIVNIVDGLATLDVDQSTKQPDWSHDATSSGTYPAARFGTAAVTINPT